MKNAKTIRFAIVLATIIFILISLTGCSNKKNTGTVKHNEKENVEILEQSGTGEIKLKGFIESPKVINKSWTTATLNEVKSFYNVNDEKKTATLPLSNGEEIWISFSGKNDGSFTIEEDGEQITSYDESVNIKDLFGSSINVRSKDFEINEEAPSTLEIKNISYHMITNLPDMSEELKEQILDRTGYFFPFIEDNKCYTLVDILNALGMQETDKTIFEVLEKNPEYYEATYNSEFGKVNLNYQPNSDSKEIYFRFEDENSTYESISITELSEKTEQGLHSEIQIYIYKK